MASRKARKKTGKKAASKAPTVKAVTVSAKPSPDELESVHEATVSNALPSPAVETNSRGTTITRSGPKPPQRNRAGKIVYD